MTRLYRVWSLPPPDWRVTRDGVPMRAYDSHADADNVATWLNDRARGYPSLKRFEGGKNWPA